MYANCKSSFSEGMLRIPTVCQNGPRIWRLAVCTVYFTSISQASVQNVNGLLFIFITETSFNFISLGMTSIPQDIALARREVSAGLYSPLAFYVSKNVANWPFNFLQVVLTVAVMFCSSNLGKL